LGAPFLVLVDKGWIKGLIEEGRETLAIMMMGVWVMKTTSVATIESGGQEVAAAIVMEGAHLKTSECAVPHPLNHRPVATRRRLRNQAVAEEAEIVTEIGTVTEIETVAETETEIETEIEDVIDWFTSLTHLKLVPQNPKLYLKLPDAL